MKVSKKWPLFALLLIAATSAWADDKEGGGISTGDGYPKKKLVQEQLKNVPAETELKQAIVNIAREFPTLANRLNTILESFKSGHYLMFRSAKLDEHEFAHFNTAGARKENFGYPDEAAIHFWNDFFDLPITDDQPDKPSQVKVQIHEYLHIFLTGIDDDRTVRLTKPLYELGRTGKLPGEEIKKIYEDVGLLYSYWRHPGPMRERDQRYYQETGYAVPLYLAVHGLKEPCEDFKLSEPLMIGGRQFQFPLLPEGLRERLEQDEFFRGYRDSCYSGTDEGLSLTLYWTNNLRTRDSAGQAWLHPFFQHPYFGALLLKQIQGGPVRVQISPISTLGGFSTDQAAIDIPGYCELYDKMKKKFSFEPKVEAGLSNRSGAVGEIPGYEDWKKIYLAGHAESEMPPDQQYHFVFWQEDAAHEDHYKRSPKYGQIESVLTSWLEYSMRNTLLLRLTDHPTHYGDPIELVTDEGDAECRMKTNDQRDGSSAPVCTLTRPRFLRSPLKETHERWVVPRLYMKLHYQEFDEACYPFWNQDFFKGSFRIAL